MPTIASHPLLEAMIEAELPRKSYSSSLFSGSGGHKAHPTFLGARQMSPGISPRSHAICRLRLLTSLKFRGVVKLNLAAFDDNCVSLVRHKAGGAITPPFKATGGS